MDNIKNFSCGGESVVIVEGVADGDEKRTATEIIKGEVMSVQAGFLKNTGIKIPRLVEAGALFSADTALCCAEILSQGSEKSTMSLSSAALETVFTLALHREEESAVLMLASKAKINLSGELPSVAFGGCEYFFSNVFPENPSECLCRLAEKSTFENVALLISEGARITPFFMQKAESACCSFSSGSAAIAAAFFESEENRDYFKKTYSFPKGERKIEMKRFLSEAFECVLTSKVKRLG